MDYNKLHSRTWPKRHSLSACALLLALAGACGDDAPIVTTGGPDPTYDDGYYDGYETVYDGYDAYTSYEPTTTTTSVDTGMLSA